MIHAIGQDIQAKLAAQGCPFKVVDREATKPTAWRNVVVIENTPDKIGPARSQSINPKRYWTRNVGATISIYAQATESGALEFEHRRVAERVLDLVLVALRKVCAERKIGLAIESGQFTTIPDLDGSDRQTGAVYVLGFSVERAVFDRTWAGAAAAEASIGSVAGCTHVGRGDSPTEEACGDCGG